MAKKQRKKFIFSTTDLNWDESTVQVTDEKTGEVHKLEVEIVKSKKGALEKVFSIRLPASEYKQIRQIAESQDLKPAHFARRAIRRAIQEQEDDLKRISKTKK